MFINTKDSLRHFWTATWRNDGLYVKNKIAIKIENLVSKLESWWLQATINVLELNEKAREKLKRWITSRPLCRNRSLEIHEDIIRSPSSRRISLRLSSISSSYFARFSPHFPRTYRGITKWNESDEAPNRIEIPHWIHGSPRRASSRWFLVLVFLLRPLFLAILFINGSYLRVPFYPPLSWYSDEKEYFLKWDICHVPIIFYKILERLKSLYLPQIKFLWNKFHTNKYLNICFSIYI